MTRPWKFTDALTRIINSRSELRSLPVEHSQQMLYWRMRSVSVTRRDRAPQQYTLIVLH